MEEPGSKSGGKPGRKVRVDLRTNRARPSRTKDWTRRHKEGEEIETRSTENVVAKGELSRKRTIIVRDDETAPEGIRRGTVVALRGQFASVDDGERVWPCTVRRVLRTRAIRERFPVTVGDRVTFRVVADGPGVQTEGAIQEIDGRRSELTRVSGRREQVIAANVDQVLIVTSAAQPTPKPHLIDRYVVSAHAGRMTPVICMNKIDLDEEGAAKSVVEVYARLGYAALCTSAVKGVGIEELRGILRGKSTVVAGQSGVGKSSLLNALQPGLKLRVAEVSDGTEKGRHTTSTAELLRLDFGAYVVDTPGIRSFDVTRIPAGELELYFVEFVPRVAECRFPDCTHTHETDCAIKSAVDAGQIDSRRYESYVKMFQERMQG